MINSVPELKPAARDMHDRLLDKFRIKITSALKTMLFEKGWLFYIVGFYLDEPLYCLLFLPLPLPFWQLFGLFNGKRRQRLCYLLCVVH